MSEATPRIGTLAGRLAHWSATRPRRVILGGLIVLALSLVSLSRLHITSSLAVMLGTHSQTAAAMQRVTTEYRSGDALLLLVELPPDRPPDDAGHAELLAFGAALDAALRTDPAASGLIAWARYREDPEFLRFAREIMLPNGAFYLTPPGAAELARRVQPGPIRAQIARNEDMIGAPGPAGVALSRAILRDPLRLLELVPPDLKSGGGDPSGEISPDTPAQGRPEFSEDGRALLIHIGAAEVGNNFQAAGHLVDTVTTLAGRLNTANLRVEPAGFAAIARDSSRVIRRDSILSTLVSVTLLYALFSIFYRRWAAGLLIGGVASVGMLAGIGALALVVREVSPLAAMIAALLAGLGTDYGIHFLSHYDGYRSHGLNPVAASVETSRQMALPIITNCFTSIFGFISLWPSKIQMLSDFAIMGAAGLIGALLAVFLLMPAALALADREPAGQSAERALFGRLADVVAARAGVCMSTSLAMLGVVVIAAGLRGFELRFEPDLTVMHPRPAHALDTTGEIIRRFSTQGELVPVEVLAPSPTELVERAHDAALALASPQCRAIGVTGVMGLHTLLPDPRTAPSRTELLNTISPARALAAFDSALGQSSFAPEAYAGYRRFLQTFLSSRHPPTTADLLQYPSLAERLFPTASLPAPRGPTGTVLIARLSAPLHARERRRAAVLALNAAAASVPGVTIAGIAAVSEDMEESARDGLPKSIAISFALVLVWLLLVFRRPLDVLLALLPLIFAASTTVLFIIATGQRFNPINSVAIPLLDGIAVDAGVFLVSVYRAHGTTRAGLRLNLRSTTHAVLLSVGTTVTAFAAICFTHTPAIRSLGLVSGVGIIASGVGALLVLMPILILRAPEPAPRNTDRR